MIHGGKFGANILFRSLDGRGYNLDRLLALFAADFLDVLVFLDIDDVRRFDTGFVG